MHKQIYGLGGSVGDVDDDDFEMAHEPGRLCENQFCEDCYR
jgi:hypothetical protein